MGGSFAATWLERAGARLGVRARNGGPHASSKAATDPLPDSDHDPNLDVAHAAVDGSPHGALCYERDGSLKCAWPEQHDPNFVQFVGRRLGRTVVIGTRSPWLDRLVTVLMVAVALLLVALVFAMRVGDLHFMTVLSGSMRPTMSPGDVAVTQPVDVSSLRVGDAIAFYPPGETAPVLHRITSIESSPDGVVITTRGDANPVDDEWHITLQGVTAYRLVAVIPFIGWLTELRSLAFICAGLLIGLWVLLELRKEVRARGSENAGHTSIPNS